MVAGRDVEGLLRSGEGGDHAGFDLFLSEGIDGESDGEGD